MPSFAKTRHYRLIDIEHHEGGSHGSVFSQIEKNNRSQLDKSLIRAFSAVLYFDCTMGGFFKMGGSGDNAERVQTALGALAKAIADNGSVSGNETIGSLTDSKIKALHGAGLLVKDCHVFQSPA